MGTGAVHHLPSGGRHFAVDEKGVGLRATWHPERGFLNLSLWSNCRCAETFHLTPTEASRLVAFLVHGLADAVAPSLPPAASLAAVPVRPAEPAGISMAGIRSRLAEAADRAATLLRR